MAYRAADSHVYHSRRRFLRRCRKVQLQGRRTAHDAIERVAAAIVRPKTRVLDFDLRAYFDNVRHDRLLEQVARRIYDADIMHLLKIMLKASARRAFHKAV